jgi:hypothetical protein
MIGGSDILLAALRDPSSVLDLGPREWNQLLLAARNHQLSARLGLDLEAAGVADCIPEKARGLLVDALRWSAVNQTILRYEVDRILRALDGLGRPVILLKGAAYLMAGLPPARGRISGDLDILVPREALGSVEAAALAHGWEASVTEEYDQHYYRVYTHQIPPLRHRERGTELDIHHTIAPPTSRARPDIQALVRDARPLKDRRLRILAPADLVLHSAVHLFNEEISPVAPRDLLDLHDLLTHFGAGEGFWDELQARAGMHGLERPLYYCLRYGERFFGTSVPPAARAKAEAFAPSRPLRAVMDRLFTLTIAPSPPDGARPGAGLAGWLLYVRSHWLRMPLALLTRHLATKAYLRAKQFVSAAPAGT